MDVYLDMDPGHDDALALVAALATADVRAVTTVAGNQTLDKTTLNARRVLWAAANGDVPVVAGYHKPLLYDLVTAGNVHGESGLDGYTFPRLPEMPARPHAMQFLGDAFASAPAPVHWIATGPLTNVAALLIGYPHLRDRIASLTLMGGSLKGGNVTEAAEFNIYVDPDAASYVMASGLPVKMVGLDVTHQALLHPREMNRLRALQRPLGDMLYGLFSFYARHEPQSGRAGMPIHDVLAVAAWLHPGLFTWRKTPILVGRCNDARRGETRAHDMGPEVEVAVGIDVSGFFDWLWQALTAYS